MKKMPDNKQTVRKGVEVGRWGPEQMKESHIYETAMVIYFQATQ